VPHICRSLFNTSDHRILNPRDVLMGGIVALVPTLSPGRPALQIVQPLNPITA